MPFSMPSIMNRKWRAVSNFTNPSPTNNTPTHENIHERAHSTSQPSTSLKKESAVPRAEQQTSPPRSVSQPLMQANVREEKEPELNECSFANETALGGIGGYKPPLSAPPLQDTTTPAPVYSSLPLELSKKDSTTFPGFIPQQDVDAGSIADNNLLTMTKEKLQAYAMNLTRKHLALIDEVVRQEKKTDQLVDVLNELVRQSPVKKYRSTPTPSESAASGTERKCNSSWKLDTVRPEEIKYIPDQICGAGTGTHSNVDVLSLNYSDSACDERNLESAISASDIPSKCTSTSKAATIRAEEEHVCLRPCSQKDIPVSSKSRSKSPDVPKPLEHVKAKAISKWVNAIVTPPSPSLPVSASATLEANKEKAGEAEVDDPAIKVKEVRRIDSLKATSMVKNSDVKQPVDRVPRNNPPTTLPVKRDNQAKKPKRSYYPPQKRGNVMMKKFSPPEVCSRQLNIEFAMDKRNHDGGGILVINAPRQRTLYYTYCEPFAPGLVSPNDGEQDTSFRKIWHCTAGLRYFKEYFSQGDLIRVHCDEKKITDERFKATGRLLDLVKEISKSVEVFHRHITSIEALHENKQMLAVSYLASGRRRDCTRIMETVVGATPASQE